MGARGYEYGIRAERRRKEQEKTIKKAGREQFGVEVKNIFFETQDCGNV